jgi:DNA-binding response OmpR family regulator
MSILNELNHFAKNYSILIVEDQKELNNELVEICQLFFRQVDSAINGKEALLKFKNNLGKYDIVLSDITMPEMDGIDLSREIKRLNRTQNIIILSAHNKKEHLIELIDIGISQFISKPFEQKELLFKLLKVCQNIFYKKEYIKMIINNKIEGISSQIIINELEKITSTKKLDFKQKDNHSLTVMDNQIKELLILIDELYEEIKKIYLNNNISVSFNFYVASILKKIYSIFLFLDELSNLAKVLLNLVFFLESLDIENLSTEKINKLKILEFIYDDISRFVETVFVYKDTLNISYLVDSLNSSIEQLKMN